MIGISTNDLPNLKRVPFGISSDYPEIGITSNIPLELIKSISVPEDKVDFVSKLVQGKNIKILPINLNEKFYYMDGTEIYFDDSKFHNFNKVKESKKFNLEDLSNMSSTRKFDGIKRIFSELKEAITNKIKGKEDNDEQYYRD